MTAISRANALFVAEDWRRIYEAITNVDFRAYDFDNLSDAIYSYLKVVYPDEFNDWIASSEFIMKVEILAWLSQNLSYRVDLNSRENFLATAERRESLLKLAQLVAYKVNRVRSAMGDVKITSIRTDQPLFDSDNVDLSNRTITWNDPKNENWFEQFIVVMNAAFTNRTQFGRPSASYRSSSIRADEYIFNSISPDSGSYEFSASINGLSVPFNLFNSTLDIDKGLYVEVQPGTKSAMRVFYKQDGRGYNSVNTGFFFPIKQGTLQTQDQVLDKAIALRNLVLSATNVNDSDVFVQKLDADGNVAENWTQVDTVFGEGVSFTTATNELRTIFEVDTLVNDQVRIRFGDGSFGEIPVGTFRFWTRSASPTPLVVKPNAIRNETITIPYIANNQVYYLRITFSLQTTLVNAAQSESNLDIRTRANKLFYTQNRMITGQDYNNFFLKDNSILKTKVVNRTFAGHSRYTKLHDPTGLYENVRFIANDGRLYQKDTLNVQTKTANTLRLPTKQLLDSVIKPILSQEDKRGLYYSKYPEVFIEGFDEYRWIRTSRIGTQDNGNITKNGVVIPVGVNSTDPYFNLLRTDSVFRYDSVYGPLAHVSRVIENGDASNGIILGGEIPENPRVISVFPAYRDRLLRSEEILIETNLSQTADFGLRWDNINQLWKVIDYTNLDRASDFSLDNAGDISGTQLDASWVVRFEYQPGQNGNEPSWEITDRGVGLFFESSGDVNFFYANDVPVIDPTTGYIANDSVRLLANNESRDSLRRRNIKSLGSTRCGDYAFQFVGNGTTTCFKTGVNPIDPVKTLVIVDGIVYGYQNAYTITRSVTGDSICFYTAPSLNAQIEVRISNTYRLADSSVQTYLSDGTTVEYDLGVKNVLPNNVIVSVDGIMQNPSLDYGIGTTSRGNSTIVFNGTLSASLRVTAHIFSGIGSSIFYKTNARGDGTTTNFLVPGRYQTQHTIFITIDGVLQKRTAITVQDTDIGTNVIFADPPPSMTHIVIWSTVAPSYTRILSYQFGGDSTTVDFVLTGIRSAQPKHLIVAVDGVTQEGPWLTPGYAWSLSGGNKVTFVDAPPSGTMVTVIAILSTVGEVPEDMESDLDQTGDNLGDTGPDTTSCSVTYLGEDIDLWVADTMRYDNGYTNSSGLMVKPPDLDRDGFYDRPFLFNELVIQNGSTDLVLWARAQVYGQDIWKGINQLTTPKGTYGYSTQTGQPILNGSLADGVADQDIHLDQATGNWLIADQTSGKWILSPNQDAYRSLIGRDHLRFEWLHYSPESDRIDPSPGNLHDVYLLTSGYDDAVRSWVQQGAVIADMPIPPDSESLRIQYAGFNQFKAMSDSMIFHSMRYKPLFGASAVPELQATFKLIKTVGSSLTDNDLKLKVLSVLSTYFDASRWDAGEEFFFTELSAFMHAQLAPNIQTFVIVPKSSDYAFGRMFQVQSEPEELFISTASLDDIELIDSLSDNDLRVGVFSG